MACLSDSDSNSWGQSVKDSEDSRASEATLSDNSDDVEPEVPQQEEAKQKTEKIITKLQIVINVSQTEYDVVNKAANKDL